MKNIFKNKLYALLKKDVRLWDKEKKELNETLLKDLIDKLDEKLLGLLLDDKEAKEKFFIKVKDVFVLKQNELKFFIDENKLDNSYTQYQNKIGLRVGNKLLSERDEVVLDWPFKDCVLEGGMTKEDQKRNEIFFNVVLAKDEIDRLEDPKALVNWKRYTANGAEKVKELERDKDGTIRENLIIKGNNLLALHSLKEQFAGMVKLIYIDPPYNRDADTFYNDNFKHSTWLTFMKNRLEVAKDLLRDDGVIFVQCDDNEQAYLKVLMDKIFGKDLLLSIHHIQVRYGSKSLNERKDFQELLEYVLIYKNKNININFNKPTQKYPLNKFNLKIQHSDKPSKQVIENGRKVDIWDSDNFTIKEQKTGGIDFFKETWISGSILSGTGHGKMYIKIIDKRRREDGNGCLYRIHGIGEDGLGYRYYTNPQNSGAERGKMYTKVPLKILEQVKKGTAKKESPIINYYDFSPDIGNISHEGGFSFNSGKKPIKMLKQFINYFKEKNCLVLDFFAGSASTAHAVLQLNKEDGGNRKFLLVEQMDYINTITCPRVQKIIEKENIDDSFIYLELAKWNEEAKEKILKAKSLSVLEKLFDELYERYFLNYNVKTKEFKEKTIKEEEFKKLGIAKQKKLFVEMLDMNQMYVNFSERADKKYNLSKEDIALSEEFYKSKK